MAAKTTSTKKKTASTKKHHGEAHHRAAERVHREFSAEERAAMKEYARELKAQRTRKTGEAACSAAIAKMKEPDRTMAKRVTRSSWPRPPTWRRAHLVRHARLRASDDKVLCFFQDAQKFKSSYATLGFSDEASLDKGGMWPTSYALMELTPAEEKKIGDLVKKAAR